MALQRRAACCRWAREGGSDRADYLFEHRMFHGFDTAPRTASVHDRSLEETVDRFCQSIGTAVADVANAVFEVGCGQALRVANRQILAATSAFLDEPHVRLIFQNQAN